MRIREHQDKGCECDVGLAEAVEGEVGGRIQCGIFDEYGTTVMCAV